MYLHTFSDAVKLACIANQEIHIKYWKSLEIRVLYKWKNSIRISPSKPLNRVARLTALTSKDICEQRRTDFPKI